MTEVEKRYLPSYRRSEVAPPMQFTPRDGEIVRSVHEYRMLTSEHIEALFFRSEKSRGRQTSCQRRLQLLYHHSFLNRLQQPLVLGQGRAPFIYVLDTAGTSYLMRTFGLDRKAFRYQPTQEGYGTMFVNHSLAINSVRVAFGGVSSVSEWEVAEWITDYTFRTSEYKDRVPALTRGNRVERKYPDGYCVVKETGGERKAHFFLEVDEGTMSTTRWKEKIAAYTQFRTLGYTERHYGTRNCRVLTVTTSERRLETLKQATEQAGGDRFFWFTTHAAFDIFTPSSLLSAQWAIAGREGHRTLLE